MNDAIANGKDSTGLGSYLQGVQSQIEAMEYVINFVIEQGRIHISLVTAIITITAYIVLLASVVTMFFWLSGGG